MVANADTREGRTPRTLTKQMLEAIGPVIAGMLGEEASGSENIANASH